MAITGANADKYTLTDSDVGTTISVRVDYTDGFGTAESLTSAATAVVTNVNDTPVGLPIITGTVEQGQVLTAETTGISDDDGLGTFQYQWLRDGAAIGGANSSSYTLVSADVGTAISVTVSYTDGHGAAEAVTSNPTGSIGNVNDAPTGSPTILGLAQEDQTLTVDTTAIGDSDGLGAFSYQWLRDGTPIAGATGASYTLGDSDVGAAISARVDYIDGGGTPESLTTASTATVTNVNDAPSGTPVISGTPQESQTLSVGTSTIADDDGLGTFSYQWLRDGVAIGGRHLFQLHAEQ